MINNKVSVIMPCKNSSFTIAESIESVLSQSYSDLELIIVDDGSTDDTLNIAASFASIDDRVKLFSNPVSSGVASTRNKCLEKASGRFVAFLDSDDYWTLNSLELRVNLVLKSGCVVVYGDYERLFSNGRTVRVRSLPIVYYKDMLNYNYIGNLTGLYDRFAIGLFKQEDIRHEDYLMWCNILNKSVCACSVGDNVLGYYRVSNTSLSGNKIKSMVWHWNILRNGLKISFFKSLRFQSFYILKSMLDRIVSRIY